MVGKIYTKFGDKGQTKLLSGDTVFKNHLIVEACGNIDELNAILGLLRAKFGDSPISKNIYAIQENLFNIAAKISQGSKHKSKSGNDIAKINLKKLEDEIDKISAELPTLKNFVIPGNNELSAICHIARTVCRRAERALVNVYTQKKELLPINISYLNRLSDYLFVLARKINYDIDKKEDKKWIKNL